MATEAAFGFEPERAGIDPPGRFVPQRMADSSSFKRISSHDGANSVHSQNSDICPRIDDPSPARGVRTVTGEDVSIERLDITVPSRPTNRRRTFRLLVGTTDEDRPVGPENNVLGNASEDGLAGR